MVLEAETEAAVETTCGTVVLAELELGCPVEVTGTEGQLTHLDGQTRIENTVTEELTIVPLFFKLVIEAFEFVLCSKRRTEGKG